MRGRVTFRALNTKYCTFRKGTNLLEPQETFPFNSVYKTKK